MHVLDRPINHAVFYSCLLGCFVIGLFTDKQGLSQSAGFGYPSNQRLASRPTPTEAPRTPGPPQLMADDFSQGRYFAADNLGTFETFYDPQAPSGYKYMRGVDSHGVYPQNARSTWNMESQIPWEAFAFGEYIGPYRSPHLPEYRIRVGDRIEFIFRITRELSFNSYRLEVGDQLVISSLAETDAGADELAQTNVQIMPDGMISLRGIGQVMAARKTIAELQKDLNEIYGEYYNDPRIVVHGAQINTPLQDLRDALDARQGVGGQSITITVLPDGTINMPMIGVVPAIGLTLAELAREVNMRYRSRITGIEFTPNILELAPRTAFVLGEVRTPSQIPLTGPTTAMQAIALAGGQLPGANIRQIVVFRRDANWQLMALRIDLRSAIAGVEPLPADDIWLRHGDIVLVPKMPIQRLTELVDLYITRTLYAVLPQQGIGTIFDADAIFGFQR
ncbi:MAG TPA: polysaccharide biosynthesis/export family protein [Pirellulaceae bacterium]|nr:polysaccharide biosynthesis/export family protein [Pirellulaceae bacterium]HMO93287.1 polysaccharide biosynthesis/export family protein [Pirellulaceae bacterium]HMP70173.1 polysaccharide biosynthesis/export family protein [Pirellulaceae bacterium]